MNATPIVVAAVAVVVNDTIPVQQAPSGKKPKKRPKGKSEWEKFLDRYDLMTWNENQKQQDALKDHCSGAREKTRHW